jgi:DNA polymerase-3 subunit beta
MKLTIKKEELVNALQAITPITDKSSNKPILSNFLMEASGNGTGGVIKFSATDYEISLSGEYSGNVQEPGSVCISARKVLEVCREFLSEEIQIVSDDQLWVTLEGGKQRLRLPSVEMGLYPQMEIPELPNKFKIGARELLKCIEMTIFATLTNETRKNLMGVCLKLNGNNEAQWIATDGHRLAQVVRSVKDAVSEEAPEIIVPRKALVEIQRILERNEGEVNITFDDRNLLLSTEKMVLMTRLIEGRFPNVDTVIPKENDKEILVNRERIINALKIVSFMSSEKIKPVKISIASGLLRLESERAEYGDVFDEVPVEYGGEEIKIGFNARYLLDVLAVTGQTEKVRMRLKGSLNPCIIEVPEDTGFLSVVMPLRIEW